MTRRVWREGRWVRKRIADPLSAHRLGRWTEALRTAGLPTPRVRLNPQDDTLVFPAIDGKAGLAMIVTHGPPVLPDLLRPLLMLHRARLEGLAQFEPEAKIFPRLRTEDPPALREEVREAAQALGQASRTTPVHGDFHAGQLIRDARGVVWLLDLEDLASGPPESDLGNFAAHLATRPETRRGPARQGFAHWLGHTLRAYQAIEGRADATLAGLHGRIALIRRALKLREQGDPSILGELAGR